MRTLIRDGMLATAAEVFQADLLIEDETIALVGRGLADRVGPVDRVIDARGRYVLPGGIDVHVHLELALAGTVSSDDFETGTRAAAFGGTTTIIDFANQAQGGTLHEALSALRRKAENRACIDFGFHVAIRTVDARSLEEMDALVREQGVSSFKLFTAYPGSFMVDDASLFKALQRAERNGALVLVHAENGPVIDVLIEQALARGETSPKYHGLTRPARLEAEASARCIALAEIAHAPLFVVHLSAGEALEEVRRARQRGQRVWAETCPQYLYLSQRNLEEPGFESAKYVFSPPVRAPGNEEALWRGLALDDISVVSTDHCPFYLKGQKDLGRERFTRIPNGLPGIETRMMLLWDGGVRQGRFDVCRFVELTSTAPAKLFGLHPRKGTLAPGADADVVIWDPERELVLDQRALHMNVDYSPYEGRRVRGAPEKVFSRGRLIVDGEAWLGRPGDGRYLARAPMK